MVSARSSLIRLKRNKSFAKNTENIKFSSRYPIVVQQETLYAWEVWESTELAQVVITEVDSVELIECCTHILNFRDLVS